MRTIKQLNLFVGTYTTGSSKGIYAGKLDLHSGELRLWEAIEDVENPSFLVVHPNGRFVYAVNEVANFRGEVTGAVSSFKINPENLKLKLINVESSKGVAPCHISLDRTGNHLLVANYMGGSVVVLPLSEDGSIGKPCSFVQHEGSSINPNRQEAAHAHNILVDPGNKYAMVADLGMDKVMIYRFNKETGELTPNNPTHVSLHPGAGPRHFAFHPNGEFAYVINELDSSITVFDYNSTDGTLQEKQRITTLPKDFHGENKCSDIHVHPSGKFLYGGNRGHDSIASFYVSANGKLTARGHVSTQGRSPRGFTLDPTGRLAIVANQDTSSVVTFQIDGKTGELIPTGHSTKIPNPVSIGYLPIASN